MSRFERKFEVRLEHRVYSKPRSECGNLILRKQLYVLFNDADLTQCVTDVMQRPTNELSAPYGEGH